MRKYVIERHLPNAGKLTSSELHDIAVKSNKIVSDLQPRIQWIHSYVTEDKLYCVYLGESADVIMEHAKKGGFPANKVTEVKAMFDPTTGRP